MTEASDTEHTDGQNAPLAEHINEAISRIESFKEDRVAEHSSYMARCKTILASIASVYDIAKERGIRKKELRALVQEREYKRKAQACRDNLEADEQDHFDMLRAAVTADFMANTELGQAAVASAKPGDVLDQLTQH